MTPEREAILAKVRKLLALGKSSNPHEAALAMQKAQALMSEHAVTEEEIRDIQERSAKTRVAEKPAAWMTYLARSISDAFGVARFIGELRQYQFVGPEFRAAIAVYAYDVLSRQVRGAVRAFMAGNKKRKAARRREEADTFAFGYVYQACALLAKIAPPSEDETSAVQQYLRRYDLDKVSPRNTVNTDAAAFIGGIIAGSGAKLYRGADSGAGPAAQLQQQLALEGSTS